MCAVGVGEVQGRPTGRPATQEEMTVAQMGVLVVEGVRKGQILRASGICQKIDCGSESQRRFQDAPEDSALSKCWGAGAGLGVRRQV